MELIYFGKAFVVLTAAASTLFAYLVARRINILRSMKKIKRLDNLGTRLRGVATIMFGQKKLFYDFVPGLSHALIFWGFCVVTVESINFFLSAFSLSKLPYSNYIFKGIFELFSIAVILSLGYAFYRRLFVKVTRVHKSLDGILILSLIMGLMITGLLLYAEETVLFNDINGWKFVSNSMIVPLVVSLNRDANVVIYNISWWVHGLIFLIFLCYLPVSKHMHILTVIFNVFFRKLTPSGRITKLDIENSESFGLTNCSDLTWKDCLDGFTCTECGRCTEICPANKVGKNLDPKQVILDLRDFVYKNYKNGRDNPIDGMTTADDIWNCTTCHGCETSCPVMNEHLEKIIGMRQNLVLMEGEMTEGYKRTFKNFENNSNPWGLPSSQRGELASRLDLPLLKENPDAKYLYFMGCAACYDTRAKDVAKSFTDILHHADINYAVLGDEEFCCGETVRRMGNEYLFQEMITMARDVINKYNLEEKEIICTCPHCYNTLKNEYNDFGINFSSVYHHADFLNDLLMRKQLPINNGVSETVTFHDSCYLARYNNISQAPRNILKQLGHTINEMDNCKREGMCCGAGGGMMWQEEDPDHRVNIARVKQAQKSKASEIVASCPYCISMFEDGLKAVKSTTRIYDISEIIRRDLR